MRRGRLALLCVLLVCLAAALSAAEEALPGTVPWCETQPFGIRHGPREGRRVAITMDDCNNIQRVRELFELSRQYDIPVTFFPTGSMLKDQDAELWRAIAASDCEIGSHTMHHRRLTDLPYDAICRDIRGSQERLDEILGYHYGMVSLRPPYGSFMDKQGRVMPALKQACLDCGYRHVVLWDLSDTEFSRARSQMWSGRILLFHAYKADVSCLRQLIPWLLQRGYEPVTVRELLELPEIHTTPMP